MAIDLSQPVVHLPFGDRAQYGSPYPEGIAVGHRTITGDATGGQIDLEFTAEAGFIYRLELVQLDRQASGTIVAKFTTSHRWAGDKSGLGTNPFLLQWPTRALADSARRQYTLWNVAGGGSSPMAEIRRFPLGRLDKQPTGQILVEWNLDTNTDGVIHRFNVVFTYWRKEALSLPGFLSSFYEAPVVPSALKVGA